MSRRLTRRIKALYRLANASLAGRLVLGSTLIIALSLIAATFILPALYHDRLIRWFDTLINYEINQLVSGVRVDKDTGKLAIDVGGRPGADGAEFMGNFTDHYSGNYWQVEDERGRILLRSQSLHTSKLATRRPEARLVRSAYNIVFAESAAKPEPLRVVSVRLEAKSLDTDLVYSVAYNRDEIDKNIEDFRLMIALSLIGLGLVLVGTVFLQVRYGLLPLRRIPDALASIRSGQSDRLTGSFPAEVAPLAREINALLDHNAEVVERARTHVGNLAHALKTPLAVLTNEAASREGELASTVAAQTVIMRSQVDHHLSRARMAARAGMLGARTSVMPIMEGLARTLEKIYRERGIAIAFAGPPDIAFRGEKQDLEEMLGNLMDNACKWAQSRVSCAASVHEGTRLRIEIGDDGPGVPTEQRRVAQKRGVRLDEKAPGSGLGLAIVKDIAETYGGSFTMAESKFGGLLAVLDLPLAGAPAARKVR
jgi:signal transduction histidine kinase